MRPVVLFTSYLLLLAPGILGHQLVPRGAEEETILLPLVIDGRPVKEFNCGPKTYTVAKYQNHIYEACKRKPSNLWRGPKRYVAPIGKEYFIRGPYYSLPLKHETPAPNDEPRPLDLVILTRTCEILGMITPRRKNIHSKNFYDWVKGLVTPAKYDYDKCRIVELSEQDYYFWQNHYYLAELKSAKTVKQGQQQNAKKSKPWWFRGKESVAA